MTEARALIQQGGVNGFSYGDLAAKLDIKSPSIHHHFPRKDDLVAAVTAQYREEFNAAAAAITDGPAPDMIRGYAQLFTNTASIDRMCLCGAVSAEWVGVGEATRVEVSGFFDDQVTWLSARISDGVSSGLFDSTTDVDRSARMILAGLEGAILMSRAGDSADLASTICDAQLGLMAR
jgi:TetR/AcrR family transcriptional repressor of nem operon